MPAAGADFVGVISTSPQAKIFELGKNSPTTPPLFFEKSCRKGGVVGCNRTDIPKKIHQKNKHFHMLFVSKKQ